MSLIEMLITNGTNKNLIKYFGDIIGFNVSFINLEDILFRDIPAYKHDLTKSELRIFHKNITCLFVRLNDCKIITYSFMPDLKDFLYNINPVLIKQGNYSLRIKYYEEFLTQKHPDIEYKLRLML